MPEVNTISDTEQRRRWLILAVIGIAQLMVVLDATVMNIALPSAQRALHFTTVDRQWVVTAYTLAFGSLLLLGGRLSDLFGRKVTFLVGLTGFAGVSAVGGASVNFAMLVTARACQGAFGALLVPSALSLLTTTFSDPKDRGKAFGVYGGWCSIATGVASATVTVGQQLGASIGTSLLNTIFASAVTSYVVAHAASARLLGRQSLTALALAHGYDTAFWWTADIFAGGAVICGSLLRRGPLYRKDTPAAQPTGVRAAQAEAGPAVSA